VREVRSRPELQDLAVFGRRLMSGWEDTQEGIWMSRSIRLSG